MSSPLPLTPLQGDIEHAALYDSLASDSNDTSVQKSYRALIDALADQYDELLDSGYTFSFGSFDYPSSQAMFDDVSATSHLKVLDTSSATSDHCAGHPMFQVMHKPGRAMDGVVANNIFRAVHDMYGHYRPQNSFSPRGEFRAWVRHMATLPKESWMALWCETRGQNAWTNYAYRHNYLHITQRPFAENKCAQMDIDEALMQVKERIFEEVPQDASVIFS